MTSPVKIGTRDSLLAMWQAKFVQQQLLALGVPAEIIPIKSEGDLNLTVPLYEVGVQGIFTKTLDIALLNGTIDIAVHSYKDVPTQTAGNIEVYAVLERDNPLDVLVLKDPLPQNVNADTLLQEGTVATSSIRRKAQWLHRYPHSKIDNIRGNVISRLEKLQNSNWTGAIFAAAGLERLNLPEELQQRLVFLNWMVSAPAQGTIVVTGLSDNTYLQNQCKAINHNITAITTLTERRFLRLMQGGCSTPISAFAWVSNNNQLHLKVNITAVDGSDQIEQEFSCAITSFEQLPETAAASVIAAGAGNILKAKK